MIDPGGFREIVQTVTVQHPMPFIIALFLAFVLGTFAFALASSPPMSWILVSIGGVVAAAVLMLAGYTVIRRPELLRSEQHSLVSRAMDILLDDEANADARLQAGRIVDGTLSATAAKPKVPRKRVTGITAPKPESNHG